MWSIVYFYRYFKVVHQYYVDSKWSVDSMMTFWSRIAPNKEAAIEIKAG